VNSVLHAFEKQTGRVLWKRDLREEFGATVMGYGFKNSNSSPVLARWQGREVLLAWNVDGLQAADPNDGTKLRDEDGRVFLSSAYDGARMIKDGQILWSQEKLRVYYTAVIREGETLYASIGVTGEDGGGALAHLSPAGVEVMAKTRMLSEPARTPPSLGGTVLYLRDGQKVLAVDLSGK
jgi:hypothetical protein